MDGKYNCCGEGSSNKGCVTHRHRARHHNDWPYTAALLRAQAIVNYSDTRQEYLSIEDMNLETGIGSSLAFGQLLRWRSRTSLIEEPTFYLVSDGYLETYTKEVKPSPLLLDPANSA